ncbi:MFS transporter [Pseudomonas japonica]|uniref:MFS transporter n=1 Tax=Pseudomonas japonica TaxID=256466 RepID=UPI001C6119FA|nr:MFS transporter [Pseudomonas japonica]
MTTFFTAPPPHWAPLPEEDFLSWGWRVPFLLSAGLVFLGLWIRSGIGETPDFEAAKATGNVAKMPIVETLRNHWREVLIAAGLKVVEAAPFYIFSTFVVSYATGNLGYSKVDALHAVMCAAVVASVLIPLMGWLSDKLGRRTVYTLGIVLSAAFIYPYFMLLDTRSVWGITTATVIALGLLWEPITAVLGTLSSEIFSTRVRYTGITLGYQLGAALAGGTAPLIATWLLGKYQGAWQPVANARPSRRRFACRPGKRQALYNRATGIHASKAPPSTQARAQAMSGAK